MCAQRATITSWLHLDAGHSTVASRPRRRGCGVRLAYRTARRRPRRELASRDTRGRQPRAHPLRSHQRARGRGHRCVRCSRLEEVCAGAAALAHDGGGDTGKQATATSIMRCAWGLPVRARRAAQNLNQFLCARRACARGQRVGDARDTLLQSCAARTQGGARCY